MSDRPPIWRWYKLEVSYGADWRTVAFYPTEREAVQACSAMLVSAEFRITRGGLLIRRGEINPLRQRHEGR